MRHAIVTRWCDSGIHRLSEHDLSFLLPLRRLLIFVDRRNVSFRIQDLDDRVGKVLCRQLLGQGRSQTILMGQRRKKLAVDHEVEASKILVHVFCVWSAGGQHMEPEALVAGRPVVIEDAPALVATKPDLFSVHANFLLARGFAPSQCDRMLITTTVADKVPRHPDLAVLDHLADILFRVAHLIHGAVRSGF